MRNHPRLVNQFCRGSAATLACLQLAVWIFSGIPCPLQAQENGETTPLTRQSQQFVEAADARGQTDWEAIGVENARSAFNALTQLFGKGPTDVATTDAHFGDDLRVRIYRPQAIHQKPPVIVYFHGGGWVLGNIDTHDALCRSYCAKSGCVVVSVDYRLAPEHPFPLPLIDCYKATEYIAKHADELDVDATKLVVAGDSAGGNLAAAVALKARHEGGPKIAAQVLIYPVLDDRCDTGSYVSFATGKGLTKADMLWFWKQYTGREPHGELAAPARAASLKNLPPTCIITAQYDVLRDEAEAYAARLKRDGVRVEWKRFQGLVHGFLHFKEAFAESDPAMVEIARITKALIQ